MNKFSVLLKIGLTVSLVVICEIVISQTNFMSGFIITSERDTINGFIDYQNWDINPNIISFRKDNDTKITNYTPNEIFGFYVNGELYEGAVVQSENSTIAFSSLQHGAQLNLSIDTVFLTIVIQGEKSLYFQKTRFGREQLYIKPGDDFDLLIYKKYLDGLHNPSILENTRYKAQLSYYLKDCLELNSRIANAKYTRNSIEKLFTRYYDCAQKEMTFFNEKEKFSIDFGLVFGFSSTFLNFHGRVYDYLTKVDYPVSYNPTFGFFFEVIPPRMKNRGSLFSEFIMTYFKTNGQFDEITSETYYKITYTNLNYSYIKWNNLFRYRLPVGNALLFANGGMSTGFVFNRENIKIEEAKYGETERYDESIAFNDNLAELGFLIGLGARYRNFSLEIRNERTRGMSKVIQMNSPINRYYLMASYTFN